MPLIGNSVKNYRINQPSATVQIREDRAPSSTDNNFEIGSEWLDESSEDWYKLSSKPLGVANWVQLGTTATSVTDIQVDTSTPPGTDPVVPDGANAITLTGGQVAAGAVGANVIQTNSLAANTATIQIQQSTVSATEDTSANGVCHFNSGQFTVSNGFVSLAAGNAIESFIPDSGTSPVVPDGSGQVTITSTNGVTTVGGTNTLNINVDGTVPTSYPTDSGTATPSGNALTIAGGTNMNTAGAAATVTINLDTALTGLTSVEVGDLTLSGGTIATTAMNNDITIDPHGSGNIVLTTTAGGQIDLDNLSVNINTLSSTNTNGNIILDPDGTGDVQVSSGDVDVQGGALVIDPGASGDSYLQYNINTTAEWRVGVDDDDGDAYKISQGSALGTNDTFIMTAAGERTMPLQPLVVAYVNNDQTNVSGAGATYVIPYDIEEADQNSDYNNSTYTFTAPVTGFYFFSTTIRLESIGSSMTSCNTRVNVSSGTRIYFLAKDNPASEVGTSNNGNVDGGMIVPMTASETAQIEIIISGSSGNTAGIGGLTGNTRQTWLSIALIA